MIRLTLYRSGKALWVNPEHITGILQSSKYTLVCSLHCDWKVVEAPSVILKQMPTV